MTRRSRFLAWFVLLHCLATFILFAVVWAGGQFGVPHPVAIGLLYLVGFPLFFPGAWLIGAACQHFGVQPPDTLLLGLMPLNSIFWGFVIKSRFRRRPRRETEADD